MEEERRRMIRASEILGTIPLPSGTNWTDLEEKYKDERPDDWICTQCGTAIPPTLTAIGWLSHSDYNHGQTVCDRCHQDNLRAHHIAENRDRQISKWHLQEGRRPAMRLETFVPQNTSQSNALRAATTIAGLWRNGKVAGGLWLWSTEYGVGKTHLLYSLIWVAVDLGLTVAVYDEVSLLNEIKGTYNGDTARSQDKILNEIATADVAGLDDLGRAYVTSRSTDWYKDIMYNILNIRYEVNKPLIITTNMSQDDLGRNLGGAQLSRLKGLIPGALKIEGQDYRIRR